MKKIYLTIITIAISLNVAIAQALPTCSLNAVFLATGKVGIFPDSATNFISGTVGVPYVQNLTVRVPKDTTSPIGNFCFNRFVVATNSTVTNYNFPPGLNLGSSTAALASPSVSGATSLLFPGNANNCASIYGTPTLAGTYTLSIKVTPYMNASILGCTNINGGTNSITPPQILNYYKIVIAPAVGVQEIGKDKMGLYQNSPNPFSATTDIRFYVEGEDDATITVYNALGDIVIQKTSKTQLGENKVNINAGNLASGTYMYSLKYKNAVATKRMVILNN